MKPRFEIVQLIGANFDIEHDTLRAFPETEHGVSLFFSACAIHPSFAQIRQWCALARQAEGAPVDCIVWAGEGETRKPIGGARMRWLPIVN